MEQVAYFPLPSSALQVMVALPSPLAVTRPEELTVATLLLLVDHVTLLFVALLGDMVAVSCWVSPTVKVAEVVFKLILVTEMSSSSPITFIILNHFHPSAAAYFSFALFDFTYKIIFSQPWKDVE